MIQLAGLCLPGILIGMFDGITLISMVLFRRGGGMAAHARRTKTRVAKHFHGDRRVDGTGRAFGIRK